MSRSTGENEPGTLNAYAVEGSEIVPDDRFGYKVIAHVHTVRDAMGKPVFWSVYRGFTGWSDGAVMRNGDIVSHDVAKGLFPTLEAMMPDGYYM